jgi:serine/threonine protein kinase
MTSFAPQGTRLAQRLGIGSVFEVAIVRDAAGRALVCKRVAPRARASAAESALDREREIIVALKSAELPELVEWGADERGGFLLETPVAGTPLRSLLDGKKALDSGAWLAMARATSRALSALHAGSDERGPLAFVHGDISPDNLFFDPSGTATFVDLSSATFRDAPLPVFPNHRGTLPYVSPEIARGEAPTSAASDSYALAATLLAVAVGSPIVEATTDASRLFEVATRGIDASLIDRRTDLPKAARQAIARALAFDPRSRLASSRELAHELQTQVG